MHMNVELLLVCIYFFIFAASNVKSHKLIFTLYLSSHTGNPLPTVSWYRNNRKLIPERIIVRQADTGAEIVRTPSSGASKNHSKDSSHGKGAAFDSTGWDLATTNKSVLSLVLIEKPSRADIGALLRCQATNIDSLKPIIRLLKIDVNCKYCHFCKKAFQFINEIVDQFRMRIYRY